MHVNNAIGYVIRISLCAEEAIITYQVRRIGIDDFEVITNINKPLVTLFFRSG